MPTQSGPSTRGPGVKYAPQEIADANLLDSFRYRLRNWWGDVKRIEKQKWGAHEPQRQKLISRAYSIRDMIYKAGLNADQWKGWVGLNGLGIAWVPVISAGAIGVALYQIKEWADDFAKEREAYLVYQQALSTGATPTEAAQAAAAFKAEEEKGLLTKLFGEKSMMILVGGGLLIAGFFIWRKRRSA